MRQLAERGECCDIKISDAISGVGVAAAFEAAYQFNHAGNGLRRSRLEVCRASVQCFQVLVESVHF